MSVRNLAKYAAKVAVAAQAGYLDLTATDSDDGTVPNQTKQKEEEWFEKIKQERDSI